jgi:hypothetical protein
MRSPAFVTVMCDGQVLMWSVLSPDQRMHIEPSGDNWVMFINPATTPQRTEYPFLTGPRTQGPDGFERVEHELDGLI